MPVNTYERYDNAGEMIPDAADTSNHLPLRPREVQCMFTLSHIPSRWAWHKDHGWYPDLNKISHKPGANGVQAQGNGPTAVINPLPSITGHQAVKGATILNRKDRRLPGGDYMRRHLTKNGQWHHALPFERWTRVGAGKLRKRFNLGAYVEWLREIEDAGMIPPMAEDILEDKLSVLDNHINRLRNDPRIGNAAVEINLNGAIAKREKMTEDWERLYGPDTEPATKGKK